MPTIEELRKRLAEIESDIEETDSITISIERRIDVFSKESIRITIEIQPKSPGYPPHKFSFEASTIEEERNALSKAIDSWMARFADRIVRYKDGKKVSKKEYNTDFQEVRNEIGLPSKLSRSGKDAVRNRLATTRGYSWTTEPRWKLDKWNEVKRGLTIDDTGAEKIETFEEHKKSIPKLKVEVEKEKLKKKTLQKEKKEIQSLLDYTKEIKKTRFDELLKGKTRDYFVKIGFEKNLDAMDLARYADTLRISAKRKRISEADIDLAIELFSDRMDSYI